MKSSDDVFGMTNLNPQKAGLSSIVIRSLHGGIFRATPGENVPWVKMDKGDLSISISISEDPKVLSMNKNVALDNLSEFQPGIEYVARNYDIFLEHYNDTSFAFDDEDLFRALRDRGEYQREAY